MPTPDIGNSVRLTDDLWGAEFKRMRWNVVRIPAGATVRVLDAGFLTGGGQRQVDLAWKSRVVRVPAEDFARQNIAAPESEELPRWIGAA